MSAHTMKAGDIARALIANAREPKTNPDLDPVIDLGRILSKKNRDAWNGYVATKVGDPEVEGEEHILEIEGTRVPLLYVRYLPNSKRYEILHIDSESEWREDLQNRADGTLSTEEVISEPVVEPLSKEEKERTMRVRIEYSLDVSDMDKVYIAAVFLEWPSRDTIKEFFYRWGTDGLVNIKAMWTLEEVLALTDSKNLLPADIRKKYLGS